MRLRTFLPVIVLAWMPAWVVSAAGAQKLPPPTGEKDLVVFIAQWKPDLYRLVGQQPVPYGTAKFTGPTALVADPTRQCFYVFDKPQRLDEPRKIWRIDAQGNPTLVFQGNLSMHNGPFGKPVGMGLDETGRLLIADALTGLWRLENDGRWRRDSAPDHQVGPAARGPG
ncbi:MAG: hypothetical protein ABFE01_02705 [Phycisphaerales bacterium]